MDFSNHIYERFDPIAIHVGPLAIHWYGIMYMLALVSGFWVAKTIIRRDNLPLSEEIIDNFALWEMIGVIVGARLGFIFFYDPHTMWYLTHPWEIFNPFMDGHFVGIRGFSYHGGLIGFLTALVLFCRKYQLNLWLLLDLSAISASAGYTFGRIGNFLNQELFGRTTDVPWGIYVDGLLRHPSQLYEAIFEGVAIFIVLVAVRRFQSFTGQLAMLYGMLYAAARSFCELFREPDAQLGFLAGGWLTMGQLLSFMIFAISLAGYLFLRQRSSHYLS